MTQKKRPECHGPSASSILIILIGIVLFCGFGMYTSGELRFSSHFDAYAGPIMPLTTVSGGEGLTAQRRVDFDFSTYGEEHNPAVFDPSEVLVTDTYELTNSTAEEKTVELAYPYIVQTIMERGFFPTITVEGQETEPEIYFTMDPGDDFRRAKKFDKYKELLAEKDYFAEALEEPVVADIPVKAYHFTDIHYSGDPNGIVPFLTLTFTIPKGVNVWVQHYDVVKDGEGENSYSVWFQDDLDERDAAWLFVANGDIENLTFGGNLGYNEATDSATTEMVFEYEIVETTFADLVWRAAQEYDHWADGNTSPNPGLITPEILYRDTMKRIGGDMGKGYDPMVGQVVNSVENKFYSTFAATRLQYMVFPVTIPAGETITVESRYWKESSYYFMNAEEYPEGYEIATQLGSDLIFTGLSASIQNTQWLEIQEQDIGFDLQKAVTNVTLDPSLETYSLTVCHTELKN